MVVTCTIIDILMIRKKKETRTVITNALTFFSIMKGRWVLLQAQVTVFYMKVFLISRAIFPLRPHFITGEYRVIIIIIIIKPFSLLPPKAECSLFFFCGHKPSFFFWGGGMGGLIKDTLQWVPRVLFIGKSLGFFLSAELLMLSATDIYIG